MNINLHDVTDFVISTPRTLNTVPASQRVQVIIKTSKGEEVELNLYTTKPLNIINCGKEDARDYTVKESWNI